MTKLLLIVIFVLYTVGVFLIGMRVDQLISK